mgnify:CR=1 FL=1
MGYYYFFFFSSRRRHTRSLCDWSSDCALPISFDKVVDVMKRTGHDIPSLYKETSEGGLAKEF